MLRSVHLCVEATYLVERNRIPRTTFVLLIEAMASNKSGLFVAPLDLAVAAAVQEISRAEIPNLPDRVIAATAYAVALPLVTCDGKIRASGLQTIW